MLESGEAESIHVRLEKMVQVFSNGNKSAFGRQADIQSGVLAGLVGGRLNKPSFDILQRLSTSYPQVREEWLLNGKGTMLKREFDADALEKSLASARELIAHQPVLIDIQTHKPNFGADSSPPSFYYTTEQRQELIRGLQVVHDELKGFEPAFRAIQNGIYPAFDRARVQDYKSVLRTLTKRIETISEAKLGEGRQNELEYKAAQLSAPLKGFIEITDLKGRNILIGVSVISHIYSAGSNTNSTVIELITTSEQKNVIIDTGIAYESIKALIIAAS